MGARASSIEPYKKINTALSQFLDDALARLAKTLEYRKEDLRDCNGDLSDISESLDNYMDAWFSDIPSVKFTNGSSHSVRGTAYIVHCPKLHPISYDVLKGLIEHSTGKVGLTVCIHSPSAFIVLLSVCTVMARNFFPSPSRRANID